MTAGAPRAADGLTEGDEEVRFSANWPLCVTSGEFRAALNFSGKLIMHTACLTCVEASCAAPSEVGQVVAGSSLAAGARSTRWVAYFP